MYVNDREWHTVKAALRFWQAVAKESRVHPIEHRSVRSMFGDSFPTPLTDAEINFLLGVVNEGVTQCGRPIPQGSSNWRSRMRNYLRRMGSKPIGTTVQKGGTAWLYVPADLETARMAILEYDANFRKRYYASTL